MYFGLFQRKQKKERRKCEERLEERRVGLELKYQVPRCLGFVQRYDVSSIPKIVNRFKRKKKLKKRWGWKLPVKIKRLRDANMLRAVLKKTSWKSMSCWIFLGFFEFCVDIHGTWAHQHEWCWPPSRAKKRIPPRRRRSVPIQIDSLKILLLLGYQTLEQKQHTSHIPRALPEDNENERNLLPFLSLPHFSSSREQASPAPLTYISHNIREDLDGIDILRALKRLKRSDAGAVPKTPGADHRAIRPASKLPMQPMAAVLAGGLEGAEGAAPVPPLASSKRWISSSATASLVINNFFNLCDAPRTEALPGIVDQDTRGIRGSCTATELSNFKHRRTEAVGQPKSSKDKPTKITVVHSK